jgi:hypothetical protein
VHTYANGDYEASFLTERGDDYTIGIGYNELCEETGTAWSGQIIKPGVTNVFDFQQAPFKVLEVLIKVDKNSKNYLGIFYQSNDTVYSWSGGTIFSDTSSMNQVIDTAIYLKLLPLGAYWFSKTVCSRSGQPYDYIYTDCEYVNSYLTTEYVDTITVN